MVTVGDRFCISLSYSGKNKSSDYQFYNVIL